MHFLYDYEYNGFLSQCIACMHAWPFIAAPLPCECNIPASWLIRLVARTAMTKKPGSWKVCMEPFGHSFFHFDGNADGGPLFDLIRAQWYYSTYSIVQ